LISLRPKTKIYTFYRLLTIDKGILNRVTTDYLRTKHRINGERSSTNENRSKEERQKEGASD
jgi:hypothetical protein